jgi:hypothetical protein
MARQPNYGFDRQERERKKAAKKAAKLEAKREAKAADEDSSDAPSAGSPTDPANSAEPTGD